MSAYGAQRRVYARLASTQDAAREACAEGAGEGTLILADAQEAGRGRWGRRWEAEPGQSLLLTVILKADAGAAHPGSLPLLLGVATMQALQGLGLEQGGLKWPNDLWWGRRKLGGLLVEGDGRHWFAGLGLNCLQGEAGFPAELRAGSASLRMAGLLQDREAVLAAILPSWEAWMGRWRSQGSAQWLPAYQALDALQGRPCRVRCGGKEWKGRAIGVAEDGSLLLTDAGGAQHRVQSAEIELLRPLEGSHDGRE
jgi:BirA family biotin operon repressor/biotin-[acetyl-CoA-carboxylase] ligase